MRALVQEDALPYRFARLPINTTSSHCWASFIYAWVQLERISSFFQTEHF